MTGSKASLIYVTFVLSATVTGSSLAVLTFNIWNCGKRIEDPFPKIAHEITRSKADIVLLQEPKSKHCLNRIEHHLRDFKYCEPGPNQYEGIFYRESEFEVAFDMVPLRYSRHSICQLRNKLSNKVLTIANVHLGYRRYGPYIKCGIYPRNVTRTDADILNNERKHRTREVSTIFEKLTKMERVSGQNNQGSQRFFHPNTTLILGGDFNTPSSLDYVAGTGSRHCGLEEFRWPVTEVMDKNNMIDAYRKVHPDPLKDPGNTWSPIFTEALGNGKPIPQDRIDFIYYRAGSGVNIKVHMAETLENTVNTSSVWPLDPNNVKHNKWPSDHRAVLVEFKIE